MWETRHGFPAAQRLPGNRKRYGQADVDQVRAVLEHRRSGLSLPAAIERVRAEEPEAPTSMFATLREAKPDLAVRVLAKPLMIALSRAIEDEQAARSTGGVLIGSFQLERHYRLSERRWRALAASADLTVVMSDFSDLADRSPGPIEVPRPEPRALEREWTVVLHSPLGSACLAAWEIPAPRPVPDAERRFELIWSCDPTAAQTAVLAAGRMLDASAPQVAARIPATLPQTPASPATAQRFSDDVSSRAFAYLAEAAARGSSR